MEMINGSGRSSTTGLLKQMGKVLELEAVSLEWLVMGSLMAYYPANHLPLSVQHPQPTLEVIYPACSTTRRRRRWRR